MRKELSIERHTVSLTLTLHMSHCLFPPHISHCLFPPHMSHCLFCSLHTCHTVCSLHTCHTLQYNDDRFWEPDAYEEGDEEGSTPDSSLDMGTIKIKSAQALKPADRECNNVERPRVVLSVVNRRAGMVNGWKGWGVESEVWQPVGGGGTQSRGRGGGGVWGGGAAAPDASLDMGTISSRCKR